MFNGHWSDSGGVKVNGTFNRSMVGPAPAFSARSSAGNSVNGFGGGNEGGWGAGTDRPTRTVLVSGPEFELEDDVGSHACSLDQRVCVINRVPGHALHSVTSRVLTMHSATNSVLGHALHLTVATIISAEPLKA
jgi:hypothetical protein